MEKILDKQLMRQKSVLLIHKYYWPDTPPYAAILKKIAEELAKNNFSVTIFSSIPSYRNARIKKKTKAGIDFDKKLKVYRTKQPFLSETSKLFEILNMFIFSFQAFFFVVNSTNFKTVMMSTCPPVIGSFLIAIACKIKGYDFYYHVCDVQPEVGLIFKDYKFQIIFNILKIIDKITCFLSKKIIVMSNDMKNSLLLRGNLKKDKFHIIQNISLPIFKTKKQKVSVKGINESKIGKDLSVIFTGNIGRFQSLENLIHAFNSYELSRIKLTLLGEGKELKNLKKIKLKYKNIFFKGWKSPQKTQEYLLNSDIAVVSLKKDVIKYAYPSKTITYINNGIPIVSILEEKSELAKMIKKEKIGFNIPKNDIKTIKKSFIKWSKSQKLQIELKKQAYLKKDNIFSTDKIMQDWINLYSK